MVSSILLTVLSATVQSAEPKTLALDVFKGERQVAHSIVMTCFVPSGDKKVRFFFSRTKTETGVTEVRTWFGEDGSPIRSIQTASGPGIKNTADATFDNGVIWISRRQEQPGGRLLGFPTKKKIVAPKDAVLRGGLFDPIFLESKPSDETISFFVLNPWQDQLEKYEAQFSGKDDGSVVRYHVKGPVKQSEIYVDDQGFLKNEESDGSLLTRVPISQSETAELREMAQGVKLP